MRYPTTDECIVIGLFALLVFLAVNDANKAGFQPAWQFYLGLLVAILVVMGYSVDAPSLSITPPTPPRPSESDHGADDPRQDEADK